MFRAIGIVIILYALSQFFSAAFVAFERAAVATFGAIEAAAVVSKENVRTLE